LSSLLHIVVLPSAKSDIKLAADWYESNQIGLGKKFKSEIFIAFDSILHPAKGYGPVYMGLSRMFVNNFPYVIYFRPDTKRNRIVVYAVLHEKQHRQVILEKRV
jgi:plasmid stabilization system protein ParE